MFLVFEIVLGVYAGRGEPRPYNDISTFEIVRTWGAAGCAPTRACLAGYLLFADVFVPDGGLFDDEFFEEVDALLRAKVDDTHTVFDEPVEATAEGL